MLRHLKEAFAGEDGAVIGKKSRFGVGEQKKITGTVALMKQVSLDVTALVSEGLHELFHKRVHLQLVSTQNSDSANELQGKLGKKVSLENRISKTTLSTGDETMLYSVTFDWDADIGTPGVFLIYNGYENKFFLESLILEDVPDQGRLHFICNSWIYPSNNEEKYRVFFINKTYLPSQTPLPLCKYREEELMKLRGDGKRELKKRDRVYDYAYYNDLGEPTKDPRPVLGGSTEYPYPRRGRTGRPPAEEDPKTESRLPLLKSLKIYVPRDERFSHLKMHDFFAYGFKSIIQLIKPEFKALFDDTINEFDTFKDIMEIYEDGRKVSDSPLLETIKKNVPIEILREIFRTDGERNFNFPMPQVIKEDKSAWRTDEEFAREMLAGVNPVVIRHLQEFPPVSKLEPKLYGNQNSSINKGHVENNLQGLTVDEALVQNRLFILDHHDTLMPYLRKINTTSKKTYASRTILFLNDDGTLRPLAIELSLPHPEIDQLGAVSKVYTPADDGIEGSLWQLAKAYVAVNDSGYHQLISHWLNTHAVIEPFVIATNRQLSSLHPIHKLLHPHFRDTMNINAFARQILINAGGLFEATVFPGEWTWEHLEIDWVLCSGFD